MADTTVDATRRLNVKKQTLDDAYAAPANFLEIDVINPITHGVGKKRYTDYEVRMRVSTHTRIHLLIYMPWYVHFASNISSIATFNISNVRTFAGISLRNFTLDRLVDETGVFRVATIIRLCPAIRYIVGSTRYRNVDKGLKMLFVGCSGATTLLVESFQYIFIF